MAVNSKTRIWHSIRLLLIRSSSGRADYCRKHHLFHSIGDNCTIMSRKVPLCPELISIGNNVHIASKVDLICHDAIHLCLNGLKDGYKYKEHIGCIEIGNNVFIGSNTTILGNVRIGDNVIIGAGSIVISDIPSNSVIGGLPAKVLKSFDSFVEKRRNEYIYPEDVVFAGHVVSPQLEEIMWNKFMESRS